jgi:hypothetical protein
MASVVGAVGGGVIIGTLSHPLDTIKTCQQVRFCVFVALGSFSQPRNPTAFFSFAATFWSPQGDVTGKTYGGVLQTARTLHLQGGMTRFFSGWGWRTGRMCVQSFLFDKAKTQLAPILFPHYF